MAKEWRKAAKQAMKAASLQQAKTEFVSYNYRWEHVQSVVHTAVKLARLTGGDLEIVEAAAWLHDIKKGAGDKHPNEGAKFARKFLQKTDFPSDKIPAVAQAIKDHMGLWLDEPLSCLESQILWDADKLTKIGTLAVFHSVGNSVNKDRTTTTRELLKFGLAVDWIPKTIASLHTKPAQKAAVSRYKSFKKIWRNLEKELLLLDLE